MSDASVKCLSCYHFGYLRAEEDRSGSITYFNPETLPAACRELLREPAHADDFRQELTKLVARDMKVTCLVDTIDGRRVSLEPGYEEITCQGDGLERVRELAVTPRDCEGFEIENPVPYGVMARLRQASRDQAKRDQAVAEMRHEMLGLLQQMLVALDDPDWETPQERGKAFERVVDEWLSLYDLSPVLDVKSPGEQIDFTFWLGDLFVLGEARWRKGPVSTKQIRDFYGKLLDRPPFVIGLVISMSGFSAPALKYLEKHSGGRTVLTMDRKTLELLLAGSPELTDWLRTVLRSRLEQPG